VRRLGVMMIPLGARPVRARPGDGRARVRVHRRCTLRL